MNANLVNLNVNPCKMCMPMGAVTALYGIQKCMSILHGSQGCSTYIRRHMATHYNEPADIASSSLTEEGTVFGGAGNLIKGLENLIKLYNPEVIGVPTSCLAETIGEDVPRIIRDFYKTHPDVKVKIIPVSSPGYGGTQYEGFFRALRAVVESVEMEGEKNSRVNIVTGILSPADTRYLKGLLGRMGIDYILLPDLSDNLDGVHAEEYERLPKGGTPIRDIAKMAGARATIELSAFVSGECSPGEYLRQRYGIELIRMNPPVSLRDTDAFVRALCRLGGAVPEDLSQERGRFLDAMIDSHKYNAEGRAAVFGEPDFVYCVSRLLCENGTIPVVCATGGVCPSLKLKLIPDIEEAARPMFVQKYEVLDDTDFDEIEKKILDCGANILIGNSDGRRISEKYEIELVRCGFPIHDRTGGQRVRMLGYEGALVLLDRITNTLLGNKETRFRKELFHRYYRAPEGERALSLPLRDKKARAGERTETHPCFGAKAADCARIHLPVAPKCNIQCNYCIRKYDCPNESRPGVASKILTPEEAFRKYVLAKEELPNLTVVGIAGPGDALADFENTGKTLALIREYDPDVTFCLSTNGLLLPLYAGELIRLGVSHVTVTLNAVDPEIGAGIYKFVDFCGTRYEGVSGAAVLLANQLSGLRYLTSKGVVCKVNTVLLKGINEDHVEEVVKKASELGCELTNIMQLIPVRGSAFESLPLVSNREIVALRKKCEVHIRQMHHCRQCRADAIGTLDEDRSIAFEEGCASCGGFSRGGEEKGPAVRKYAVASKSGMLVDQHFGHADEFYIYESDGENVRFKEKRNVRKYCSGAELCDEEIDKMDLILGAVGDCDGILVLRIGEVPLKRLKDAGIPVFTTYDRIENAVVKAAKGG